MTKWTIELVKNKVRDIAEGYECLSNEYVNNSTKLKFKCNNGHVYKVTLADFLQGKRCRCCYFIRRGFSKRLTIEFVKNKTREIAEGYECVSNEYINAHTKLKFICTNAHQFFARWNSFLAGHRCPYCVNERCGDSQRLNIEYVKEKTIEIATGYKCLSNNYKNNRAKLKFSCNKEHSFMMCWGSLQHKRRCPICWAENRGGENSYNWKNYTDKDREDIKLYKNEVIQLTNINYKKYKSIINPNNFKRGINQYHLDHIYSIIDGFNNNVDPNIIASPVNLRMLLEKDNISKNGNSHMTLDQLFSLHEQFLRETN